MYLFKLFITCLLYLSINAQASGNATSTKIIAPSIATSTLLPITEDCTNLPVKNNLIGGWFLWEPYQFNRLTNSGYALAGMDIELTKAIMEKLGLTITTDQVDWVQHQQDIEQGKRDIASGAAYSDERAQYSYFSKPYRFEEEALFVLKNSIKDISFKTITEYLAQTRLQNFRLGVIEGFTYGDPQINEFIADNANSDIIYKFKDDSLSLQALLNKEIDGFLSDRIVGANAISLVGASDIVKEIELGIKIPIHFIFSKKTVPVELVNRFDDTINKFIWSAEYKKIIKNYLYPVLLMQTVDANWFYIISVIGTISFAVSGLAIAARDNASLFGTFLLAMLPSIGGGIMRDVMLNRATIGIILDPSYMYYVLITVALGFSALRVLNYYNKENSQDDLLNNFWQNLLIICDSLGQASFIVTGVAVAIMAKIEPIELWGPFFAFLTSSGGSILRDLLASKTNVKAVYEGVNAEIAIIWGLIFGVFLDYNAYSPDPETIKIAVVAVVAGAFLTKIAVHYYKIPNIRFRS